LSDQAQLAPKAVSVWQSIGADGSARDAREAVALASQWLESGGENP